jgi:hypothetical protein
LIKTYPKNNSRERFALFSQPPPLGLGDSSYVQKKAKVDADGKVITMPRNVVTTQVKEGRLPHVFIDKKFGINPDNYQDLYIDPHMVQKMNSDGSITTALARNKQNKDKEK